MRRKDREIDSEAALKVVDDSQYGVLSLVDEDGSPYSIPLNIIRDGNILYFHGATAGKKVDLIENGDICGVVFVSYSEIPHIYTVSEIREIVNIGGKTSGRIFTTEYRSAIVKGRLFKVEDRDEKIKSLRILCEKYDPDMMEFFDVAIENGIDRTNVYGIEIIEITGKNKEVKK